MDYLDKLNIKLNQLKDSDHRLWKSTALNIKEKEKLSFEFEIEIHKVELLIIQEVNKCYQDNTIKK